MILFFLSVMLVFVSSFFMTCVLENKKFITAFIYFLIFSFSNVVLTFEILSLLSQISVCTVLVLNILTTLIAFIIWLRAGKPVFEFNIKSFLKRFYAALISDKYLMVLFLSVIFMCAVSLFLISFIPVVNPDAEAYHVLRSVLWVLDKKITHVPIADVRNLVMPINSELLYAWVILFLKKQLWFGIFSFCGYLLTIVSLWGILSEIGTGFRKKLWVTCILSSFASVIIQVSSTETDIIIAGLILASMYLYIKGLKTDKTTPLIISALAYAMAVGTKTPAIMMIPGVGLWMTGISIYHLKKKFYVPLLKFCGSFIILFTIFGAYNYILNFLDFGDIAGSKSFLSVHKNFGGIKALCANFIKYIFMFFDFTGFALNKTIGDYIIQVRDLLLITLGLENIAEGFHSSSSFHANEYLLEPLVGMGLLGFLIYLPCWIFAFIKPWFSKKKSDFYIMSFAFVLLLALITMSGQIVFMTFSIRFFTAFCVIAAPVLVYSYSRKNSIFKFIITAIALFYLLLLSTHIWARPALIITRYFRHGASISEVREISNCCHFSNKISKKANPLKNSPIVNPIFIVRNEIKKYDKRNKILYFSVASDALLQIALLNFSGYHIDFNIIENVENIDFKKYNIILVSNDAQVSTNVRNFEKINTSSNKYYKDGISCRYINTRDEQLGKNSAQYPYLSSCFFEPYFYKQNNFKFDRLFTIQTRVDGTEFTIDYKFYENLNNPIIR